jgi:hypothetical protein
LSKALVVERIFADEQGSDIVAGDGPQRPSAALQGVSEAESAMPGVGVDVDEEQENVIEPPAAVGAQAAAASRGR